MKIYSIRACIASFILLLVFINGFALKPHTIYKNYPHKKRKQKTETSSRESHNSSDQSSEGEPGISNDSGIGDEGVASEDAPFTHVDDASAQTFRASEKIWRFANELIPFLQTPYKYGGEDTTGVDCSGLVKRVYARAFGIALPHKAALQFKLGKAVSKHALSPGDLVFFYDKRFRRIGHVGLYLDEGQFIHSMLREGVVISRLDERYWKKYYAGARRILPLNR
ncbi:MAG: NlpC/P60 family protein [Calditrichaeota bacterium]|nr:MAG: NlpC/P60 family protein [Calditrichota bacterium]